MTKELARMKRVSLIWVLFELYFFFFLLFEMRYALSDRSLLRLEINF